MSEEQSKPTQKVKEKCVDVAEVVDAWRVFPRLFVLLYAILVYKLFVWFKGIGTTLKTKCDSALIDVLVNNGMDIEKATNLACTVVESVGGPTNAQTTFVTAVTGLATAIFGFYANSGRKWEVRKTNND